MSCPDWRRLAALRDRGPDDEPAGWREAMAHAEGCPACRRQAVAADPALLFRRLPATELSPAAERAEVEAVRQAVAAMRTASRLTRRRRPDWWQWAAAAVLATTVLATPGPAPEPAASPFGFPAALSTGRAVPATIEGLARPKARIYHMIDEIGPTVMIVDESFESLDV